MLRAICLLPRYTTAHFSTKATTETEVMIEEAEAAAMEVSAWCSLNQLVIQ
jgi:hypothetical protein